MIQQRIDTYKERRLQKEAGKVIGAPIYTSFPRLGNYLPELPKGTMIMITANSGIGKSQLYRSLMLWNFYIHYKKHPDSGFKPKWIIFLLEESKEEFTDALVSSFLFYKYGISCDPMWLNSMHKKALPIEVIQKIEELRPALEELLSHIIVEDSIYNPFGLYTTCRHYSQQWGTHYYTELIPKNPDKPIVITQAQYEQIQNHPNHKGQWKYSHYIANDSNEHVFVIADHLALLQPEKGGTIRDAMGAWSFNYCRKNISKHWKWTICNIIQQASDSEKQQFDFKGNSIINKIKPSLDGLGDNKATQRDHLVILGLFAPDRYNFSEYGGYDIKTLGDRFRTLTILKNRIGKGNLELPLYFNGASSYFTELPPADKMTPLQYDLIIKDKYKGES